MLRINKGQRRRREKNKIYLEVNIKHSRKVQQKQRLNQEEITNTSQEEGSSSE